jgi:hypothetical protein
MLKKKDNLFAHEKFFPLKNGPSEIYNLKLLENTGTDSYSSTDTLNWIE